MEFNREKLLELYPEFTSVLGPYTRQDGRKHIVLNNSNKSKGEKDKTRTISYPKALKEIELSERLLPNFTVDHLDRDFTNDDLSNLKVKLLKDHVSEDRKRVRVDDVNCQECFKLFSPTVNQINASRNGKFPAGPFCSKICVGKYGQRVQTGGEKIKRVKPDKIYYFIDKENI